MNNRERWLDTAKGLGILAVVAGHSGNLLAHTYLYWFHMPLFFIISGYLYKNLHNMQDLKKWINKRTKQLLIPYFIFGLLISAIIYFQNFSIPQFFMITKMIIFMSLRVISCFGS
jgi:fucose 4-O-acetylase-like acetyltransferase